MLDYSNIIANPFPDNRDEMDQWTPKSYNEIKAEIAEKERMKKQSENDSAIAAMFTSLLK